MTECVFCAIIAGEIPAKIVASDDNAVAFLDLAPWQDGHSLVVPRRHIPDVLADGEVLQECSALVAHLGQQLMTKLGASACNIVSNAGVDAGQEVFHAHIHVVPRYADSPGLSNLKGEASRSLEEVQEKLLSE